MPKYLVMYRSNLPASEAMGSPEEAQAGMELWMSWMGKVGGAMADMGSPIASVATLDKSGKSSKPAQPMLCGFSVLEADSVDACMKLLDDHPHFHTPGDNTIEVLEYLPIPGM